MHRKAGGPTRARATARPAGDRYRVPTWCACASGAGAVDDNVPPTPRKGGVGLTAGTEVPAAHPIRQPPAASRPPMPDAGIFRAGREPVTQRALHSHAISTARAPVADRGRLPCAAGGRRRGGPLHRVPAHLWPAPAALHRHRSPRAPEPVEDVSRRQHLEPGVRPRAAPGIGTDRERDPPRSHVRAVAGRGVAGGPWAFGDVLVGSVLLGLLLGSAGAIVAWCIARPAGHADALLEAAADRYLPASITAWEFGRSKLKSDPA